MDFGAVDAIGAVVAALACFVSGFVWFGPKTFFPVWWRAMGKTDAEVPGQGQHMGLVFGLTTVAALLQGVVMSLLLGNIVSGDATLAQGVSVGAITGVAVILPALGHRLFAGHTLRVWLLECGNDFLNFVLMGAVLSFFQ
jgi:hypothetical protein